MKKNLFAICLVAVVLIAFLVLSCTPPPAEECNIDVKATLDGTAWTGAVQYTLTGPGAAAPTIINGASVPTTHSNVDCGSWTCAYVSGGPAGATFTGITPSATQTVSAGGTIIFTLNFVTTQVTWDASIEFETWTINGDPVPPGTYQVPPGTIVDIEYTVHVSGEEDAVVNVFETKKLKFHYKGSKECISLHSTGGGASAKMSPPADKIPGSHMATVEGQPAPYCTWIDAFYCQPVILDLEVGWECVVCVDYKQSVNWVRLKGALPGSTSEILQEGENGEDEEAVFEVYTLGPPQQDIFTLTAWAEIEMEGIVDENPDNNSTDECPELTIEMLP